MLTVLEALRLSTEYLSRKEIDSPRLNAELLLADILKIKRLDLYLQFERPLSDEEKERYREYLKRRASYEPLQYILGFAEFMSKRFKVTHDVLIPRPETELLVQKISNENQFLQGRILDIGTGCGNIAVMLGGYLPEAKLTAVDISEKALEIAKFNAEKILKSENTINFIQANLFENDFLISNEPFDIIVSNPPYIAKSEYENLQPEVKNFEPQIALTDNYDGFLFYKEIINKSEYLLKDGGLIYFELEAEASEKVKNILISKNFSEIEITNDYSEIPRIIKAKKGN